MKYLIKFTLTVFAALLSFNAGAQTTDLLKNYTISEFTELQSQINTEVIIIQSNRNNILVQGSKEAQDAFIIHEEENRLSFSYRDGASDEIPTRVVVETTGFNSLISGGIGSYFIIGLVQENFRILNPAAIVKVSGTLDNIYLTSINGHTDLSNVHTNNEWITLYQNASYVESKYSVQNLLAKKSD